MSNWIVSDTEQYLEPFNSCKIKLLEIELFNHLTACIYKMCLPIIYLKNIQKQDLALNNQQWLTSHKTKPNQAIELFDHLTMRKQMTDVYLNC